MIDIYLDGSHHRQTTTFENYRDFTPDPAPNRDHDANVAANLTNRRSSVSATLARRTDGPGGQNQGFNIDNIHHLGLQ